jgi:hypothetical protein
MKKSAASENVWRAGMTSTSMLSAGRVYMELRIEYVPRNNKTAVNYTVDAERQPRSTMQGFNH